MGIQWMVRWWVLVHYPLGPLEWGLPLVLVGSSGTLHLPLLDVPSSLSLWSFHNLWPSKIKLFFAGENFPKNFLCYKVKMFF
jgi:hypothetical protein